MGHVLATAEPDTLVLVINVNIMNDLTLTQESSKVVCYRRCCLSSQLIDE